MKIAYLDMLTGISGDMTLGALIDAGVDANQLQEELEGLPVSGWQLTAEKVSKGGIQATKATVSLNEHHQGHHPHRDYVELVEIIQSADLPAEVAEQSLAVLRTVAQAEATVHGVPVEKVHFHELAGVDTLIDIVGSVIGFRLLGVERIYSSALPVSHGYVDTAHGRLPVPPPAVAEMLKGVPTFPVDIEAETVTPTGAALAISLAEQIGIFPPMIVESIGYGAGTMDFPNRPNILRLWVGRPSGVEAGDSRLVVDEVVTIEANIDDMNPELQPVVVEKLLEQGALDAWLTPIQMKKGRLAVKVSALAPVQKTEALVETILTETTSFGVRVSRSQRRCLLRETVIVTTPYGELPVKVGRIGRQVVTVAPEYEDCRQAAQQHNVPLKVVYAATIAAANQLWREDTEVEEE